MTKTMRYRIYTELKNLSDIRTITQAHFDGFTIYPAQGSWAGVSEATVVIEVISDGAATLDEIRKVARKIKKLNKQEAVFITSESIQAELI